MKRLLLGLLVLVVLIPAWITLQLTGATLPLAEINNLHIRDGPQDLLVAEIANNATMSTTRSATHLISTTDTVSTTDGAWNDHRAIAHRSDISPSLVQFAVYGTACQPATMAMTGLLPTLLTTDVSTFTNTGSSPTTEATNLSGSMSHTSYTSAWEEQLKTVVIQTDI